MTRPTPSRRRLCVSIATALTLGTAGCLDSIGGSDELERPPKSELTINLENDDGQAVTAGVDVTVSGAGTTWNLGDESNEDGQITVTLEGGGERTVRAESPDDAFDPVEETVSIDPGSDESITLVLEGAPSEPASDEA